MEQLSIAFARARRDDGIERAVDHADAVRAGWRKRARGYLLEYIATQPGQFLAEQLREFAELGGLDLPPDGRAWGHVMRSAAQDKLIRSCGAAKAKTSNLSFKVLWEPT